ncbi:MAG: SDR family NAD(P)-dependent oxidoreductase [Polyangiales bacterium]
MSKLRFDDRVAIVTGAGAGLGRSHALLLGSLGAKVVVNDLGGAATGEGKSSSAADKVVDEIRTAGGQAVANYDSVVDGAAIVKTAVDAFGRVDIVINNAGILRDVSFAKMTQGDWDIVLAVHLTGSMSVSHAAWPILREQGYGRIVMTTSAAGIYGNFGQANYSAAKLGLMGLANTLAEEGRNKNVHVNTIAPIAASRLTETVLPAEILKSLKPEAVSPLVAWLCHEDCEETKGLFEVGAGYVAKLRWERTTGTLFPISRAFTVDDVAARWSKITDFEDSEHPTTINESMAPVLRNVTQPSLGGNEFIDLDVATKTTVELESSYDENDLALYALGVGAARDALDKSELKFVYELGSEFQALPTFGVMPQISAMLKAAKEGTLTLPGMSFGFDRLLHGEQYTELRGPMPKKAKLKHVFKFKEAFDKDPNAVVTFAISSLDEDGNEVAYNEMTSFVKGAGGWGGQRGPSADVNVPPAREPDAVIEEKTDAQNALLFRLSGDWNPLHADPDFAKAFGYERPILHGLCTYGYAGRHVIKAFAKNDGRFMKSIKVRFAKNVFPGETLVTRMWKESDTRVVFETRVKERDEVVIKNAAVELFAELPKPVAKAAPAAATSAASGAGAPAVEQGVTLADIFAGVATYVGQNPQLANQTKTSFQFHFHAPDQSYFIDLKNAPGAAGAGVLDAPDVTLEIDTEHGEKLFGGDLAAVQKLYFGGTLKISGNVMASNKLAALQAMDQKLVEEARARRVAAGGGASAASGAVSTGSAGGAGGESQEVTVGDLFSAVAAEIAQKPELVDKAKTGFQFHFENPTCSFFIDLKSAPGGAGPGELSGPDVTIALDTKYLPTLFGGDMAAVQKLFFGGQLKISGNVMASNKLSVLQGMDKQRVEDARKARLAGGGATAPAATSAKAAARKAEAADAIAALGARLTTQPARTGVVQLRVKDPDGAWSIDLGANPPSVSEGSRDDAAATITVGDAQLGALVRGEANMQELFQKGALTIDGDLMLARQLEQAK